jgi:glyoxylase-like metal-dependent hydrolase (beta-lactamase superfamily II)
MISIKQFVFNPWQENTYVVYDETGECVIIDAGCFNPKEVTELQDFIKINNLAVKHILNTHLHIDHILGNAALFSIFGLKPEAHENDEFLIDQTMAYASQLGISLSIEPPYPAKYIDEGQLVEFGNSQFEIFHIPGHTPGHLVFYNREAGVIFSGDVLFQESIGRTDLIYGNYETLLRGIIQKLMPLPDSTKVFSGHGDSTTIGHERQFNPFIRHMNFN